MLGQVCAPLFVAGLRFFAVLSAVEGRGFGEQWCTLKGDGVGGGGAHVCVCVCVWTGSPGGAPDESWL